MNIKLLAFDAALGLIIGFGVVTLGGEQSAQKAVDDFEIESVLLNFEESDDARLCNTVEGLRLALSNDADLRRVSTRPWDCGDGDDREDDEEEEAEETMQSSWYAGEAPAVYEL